MKLQYFYQPFLGYHYAYTNTICIFNPEKLVFTILTVVFIPSCKQHEQPLLVRLSTTSLEHYLI